MIAMVVGCGGIGSFFIATLDKLIATNQLNGWTFECFDDDIVETKNILYQNFEASDIDDLKVEALRYKYVNVHTYNNKRVGLEDLRAYDLVLLCADNNVIRHHAYEASKAGIPFIDARSNGRTVGIFSSSTPGYLEGLSDSTESVSCQYPYQLERKEIEIGNIIIANVLAQVLLTYVRKDRLPSDFMYNF